jgi:predicted nucleic acid-binding protein
MIILDTNVISELMRREPAENVGRWLASRPAPSLCTTTITQAEILLGVHLLPKGKRRDEIEREAHEAFDKDFAGRVLPFDSEAARAFARITSARRRSGRPISQADAQIAAIARATGYDLATCNTTDFEGCGIELRNPWRG